MNIPFATHWIKFPNVQERFEMSAKPSQKKIAWMTLAEFKFSAYDIQKPLKWTKCKLLDFNQTIFSHNILSLSLWVKRNQCSYFPPIGWRHFGIIEESNDGKTSNDGKYEWKSEFSWSLISFLVDILSVGRAENTFSLHSFSVPITCVSCLSYYLIVN